VPFAAAWVWSVVQAIQTWRVSAEASLQPS